MKTLLFSALILLQIGYASAQDALILSIDQSGGIGGLTDPYGRIPSFYRYFNYGIKIQDSYLNWHQLDFGTFTKENVGTERQYTSGDFISFSSLITDGVNSLLLLPTPLTGLTLYNFDGSGTESYWLTSESLNLLGPDLHGYTISNITFECTGWINSIPGSDPNGDGHWFETTVNSRLNFYGKPIPEPSTLTLFMFFGIVTLTLRRRTRCLR